MVMDKTEQKHMTRGNWDLEVKMTKLRRRIHKMEETKVKTARAEIEIGRASCRERV